MAVNDVTVFDEAKAKMIALFVITQQRRQHQPQHQ